MRLVTWSQRGGAPRSGALIAEDSRIVDLEAAADGRGGDALRSLQALIDGGEDALALTRELIVDPPASAVVARSDVHLHAPLQPPLQLRDCSCFEQHLVNSFQAARRFKVRKAPDPEAAYRELGTEDEDRVIETFRRQPIYYKANRMSVVGIDDVVEWPAYSRAMDFELEWACYIGRKARDVPAEEAKDYIFGYTIYNDFTARDAQALEMGGQLGPAKGKDFDTGNVMGPCLVTADEIPDPYALKMTARVNGERWGGGSTAEMGWTFEQVIAHISRSETLYPGEALGSGTVGTGCGLEQMRYLQPGDLVELEVERIGILSSRLVKP